MRRHFLLNGAQTNLAAAAFSLQFWKFGKWGVSHTWHRYESIDPDADELQDLLSLTKTEAAIRSRQKRRGNRTGGARVFVASKILSNLTKILKIAKKNKCP